MNTPRTDSPDTMNAKALVFQHVPKTAGSTLKWIIQRQYPADRTVIIEGEEMLGEFHAFMAQPEDVRRRLLCLAGHIPFGVHRWLPQGARYITMLRHPVEWTLSFYAYIQRTPFFEQHPDFALFRGLRDAGLDNFVAFLERSNMVDMQTRMISGQIEVIDFLPPYEPLKDDALECAKRNLRTSFECVGVAEHFDESLLLMKRRLGWRKVHYRRLNVSKGGRGRAGLPPATLERILACHRRDVELHDEACRLLAAEVEAAGEDFQRELRRFRRNNAVYSRLLPFYEASGLYRLRQVLRRCLRAAR